MRRGALCVLWTLAGYPLEGIIYFYPLKGISGIKKPALAGLLGSGNYVLVFFSGLPGLCLRLGKGSGVDW